MEQIIDDKEIKECAVRKYSSEISQWIDVPRAVLKKYTEEKMPAALREEALLELENVQAALDYLMNNLIDEEKLLKHIKNRML